MTIKVYKVLLAQQWESAKHSGIFHGAPVDIADGYIHLSKREQLAETINKHFNGVGEIEILVFKAEDLGSALKWEPSRGGDLFPHLYSELNINLHKGRFTVSMEEDGSHVLPEEC